MGEIVGAYQQLALVETYVDPVSLVTKVRDSFRITPSFGAVWYTSVDMGFPDVRASVQDNPQADGTYDETQYTGARMITIEGVVLQDAFGDVPVQSGWNSRIHWNSASWFTRYLSGWASPARRFRLYFTDDSGVPKFIDVRGDSFSSTVDKTSGGYRSFQLNMVNPSGRTYSFDISQTSSLDGKSSVPVGQTVTSTPQQPSETVTLGRTYPLTEPRTYVTSVINTPTDPDVPPVTNSIIYDGTVSNGFVAEIHTADVNAKTVRLTVITPDGTTRSIGATNSAGFGVNYVIIIDTNERTIKGRSENNLDSSNFDDLAKYVDAPVQWPVLQPSISLGGDSRANIVYLTTDNPSPNSYATIKYYAADLT